MNAEPSFGMVAKNRRRELGLTQDELARRVGCAPITLRKIEADDLRPSVQIAERMAMALNIPLEERAAFVKLARTERVSVEEQKVTPMPAPEEIGIEDLSGRAIRGYALGERLGHGGMGVVYRAVQPLVEREVAIKIILPKYANHPDFIRRFEAEAQLVARLEHPHIVPLYDYWREPSVAYLIMRLLRGGSVQSLLRNETVLSPEIALRMMDQIGSALSSAHRAGVVHRDLKPANVLLDEDSNAYLADFGIAKNLSNPTSETQADAVLGSPDYISPEQIRSEYVRPQTDIYALGVMLYELLTGKLPFQGPTPFDVMHQHLSAPLPPLAANRAGLPKALDDVIEHATLKDPLQRYENVDLMLDDLHKALGVSLRAIESGGATSEQSIASFAENENPYKGLRAFGEGDAQDFFGREALTQQLLIRLGEGGELARFLAVVGPSGSGKSSVVKAGLIPALRRGALPGSENWFIIEMTPGAHPLEELEAALLRVAVNPPASLIEQFKSDSRGLIRAVRRSLPDDPTIELVLVIDQFEEVFTLLQDEKERLRFLGLLVSAILDENSRIRIVLTLRADFIDRPLGYVDFGELLHQRMEIVLPLTPDELESAIVSPAGRVGLRFETGLVPAIVHDLGDQPGTLPLLQYALTELYEKRDGDALTKSAYQEIGGVIGALGRRAEDVFTKLDSGSQAIAKQLFLRLVTLGEGVEDTRRRTLIAELEKLQFDDITVKWDFPGSLQKVMDAFGRARMLSFDRDPETRGPTVEVAHEAILREWKRLREWLNESRALVRMQRQLAQAASEWLEADRDTSFLLTGAKLAQYEGWTTNSEVALTQQELNYLNASINERDKREKEEAERQRRELETAKKLAETEKARAEEQSAHARRLRQRAWVLTGVLGVALILAFLATSFARSANTNLDVAQSANTQMVSERNRADDERDAAVAAQATSQAETYARATAEALAENQASLAFARELSAAAVSNLQMDPERSALLALQALRIADILEARNALRQSIPSLHLLKSIPAHNQAPGVDYSPDGKLIASIEYFGGEVKIWDAENYQLLHTFPGEPDALAADIVFNPDGKLLATSIIKYVDVIESDGKSVRYPTTKIVFWDVVNEQIVYSLDGKAHQTLTANISGHIAFSPDGRRLATANFTGLPRVFDVASQEELLTLVGHEIIAEGLAYSPDGKLLATSDQNGNIVIWSAYTGQVLLNLEHPGPIHSLAFNPNSARLASVSENGTIKVWNAVTGTELLRLQGGLSGLYDVAFTPNGKSLVTCGKDGSVRVRDVEFGQEYLNLTSSTSTVISLAVSPDGTRIVSSAYDGTVKIWDARPNGEVFTFLDHSDAVWDLDYSPDGALLASSGFDGKINIWDVNTNTLKQTLTLNTDVFTSIAFSPDGRYLASGGFSGNTYLWNVATGQLIMSLTGHQALVIDIAFSSDGKRLATGSFDTSAKIWDLSDGRELLTIQGVWYGVAFSPDGDSVFGSNIDQAVHRWDVSTGKELGQYSAEGKDPYDLAISPDGKTLAFSRQDGVVTFWDIESGQKTNTLPAHGAIAVRISFSHDGRYLATASFDRLAKVWDLQTGQEVATLFGNNGDVFDAVFSLDGTRVATTSTDGIIRIYTLNIEELIALAKSRLTRTLTEAECQKYLHMESCPSE